MRQEIKLHKEINLHSDKQFRGLIMAEFKNDQLEMFLGAVRKYMQVRGPMSQKDLAELTEVGVSTMSRFLNKKTADLNPQLIAKIVAKLNIPLHEIIDFVDEDYTDRFVRLVKFYKAEGGENNASQYEAGTQTQNRRATDQVEESPEEAFDHELEGALGRTSGGTAQRGATAKVSVGGRTQTMSFQPDNGGIDSISEKIKSLSPRQKAYMMDFLNLDMEGRDVIVDIGNNLFRYFRQKGLEI